MSEFQEIKHLYSYGIQTCLTGMHFHQDLCVFVDLGFKTFWAFYGDSHWCIHGTFIFAKTKIARVICFRDPLSEACQLSPTWSGLPGQCSQPERVQPSLWCWNKGLDVQTCSCAGCFPSGTWGTFSNRLCSKVASDTWSFSAHKAIGHNLCLEGQALPSLCWCAATIGGHCPCPHHSRPPLDQGLAIQHLLQPPGNDSINWFLPAEHWRRKTSLSHGSVLWIDFLCVTRSANHHCTVCPLPSGEVISKKGQISVSDFLVNIRRVRERLIKKNFVTSTSLFFQWS